jgi:phosphoglycolate phosphatase-like HAD superfamily hydrolase
MNYSRIIREAIEDYLSQDNIGIQAVIFDFDLTLVDATCYREYRDYARANKDWSIYDEHVSETKVYPGIKELISYLRSKGIKVIVVSDNKQSVIEHTLAYHGIQYDAIRGAQGWMNPKWKRMTTLLSKFGISPENAISVGDMPSDAVQSEKAHIRFVGCSWGNVMVNGINNPLDLIKIIEEYEKIS